MFNDPWDISEEELEAFEREAFWHKNEESDPEEDETYEEWLQGEIAYWGYNHQH
jgi:hypothetical protein